MLLIVDLLEKAELTMQVSLSVPIELASVYFSLKLVRSLKALTGT